MVVGGALGFHYNIAAARFCLLHPVVLNKTVEGYFVGVPLPARNALNQIRSAIRSTVPSDATEIITDGIPAFRR